MLAELFYATVVQDVCGQRKTYPVKDDKCNLKNFR